MRQRQTMLSRTLAVVAAGLLAAPLVGSPHRAHLSRDLADHVAKGSSAKVGVIVHGDRATVEALAARHGLHVKRFLDSGGVLAADAAEVAALSADLELDHLSGDLPVQSGMTVTNEATGADQVRAGLLGLPGVTGKGIGVAIIDSGIKTHNALNNKIIGNVVFAGGGQTDEYGHGTHVAGIIAGTGSAASKVTNLYNGGIALGASLINVKVLGADGSGLTSDVIAGIDWVVANQKKYNIRVINLSLGHPVMEPSATDPLCEAVARAVQAGIVVVASAGNYGKTETGTPVLGAISSPGNSPYAITVGSLNTWSTAPRVDDTVTTYSSRGPTRFDHRMKPDIVAPGNKIVSLLADSSYIQKYYPAGYVAGGGTNAYYRMSGTSMAAAVVSGAAALLLEANPKLDPRQVKLALQMSASYMPEAGLVGGGAGSINLPLARRIASQGLTDPLPNSSIAGLSMTPGGIAFLDPGTLADRLYSGQAMYIIWGDKLSAIWNDPSTIIWGDLNLLGLSNPTGSLGANYIIWGDVSLGTKSNVIIWGDTIKTSDGQVIIWGDSATILTSDPNVIIWGDGTSGAGDP